MSMNHGLSTDTLRRLVPAAFATQPHAAVSDRYGFVPTSAVIDGLRDEGWFPVRAQQTRVRDYTRRGVARHLIRFRQDPARQVQVGDSIAELVLTNSHDRSSAYQLDLGLFRLICSNGMVTPVGATGGIRVRHGKNVVDEILVGSIELVEAVPNIAARVDAFQSTPMSRGESELFAESALELRYGEDWKMSSPVRPADVVHPRRHEDAQDRTLWGTFNRAQENLLKGGLRGQSRSGRLVRTRPVKSVTEDVRLNRALWKLAERFAELKGEALAA
ncbi:DUF932 domain-containing protein [Thioalkalivibrio sp.]|uniref:DUF932 domain-containing protein n=1 Tax=Thioalkalivibrio sp. TaxID=2093813 RepID=UPI0012D4FDDB|nr:DUF932 domain-containing protein [Thioalkalivibrio sp.]TVP80705.1 MAG: DUF945 domain-containing protein [Thioalkalivibrio sp.]